MSTGSSPKQRHLSKSRFVAGLQCPKRLYLEVHTPEGFEAVDGGSNLQIINGYAVGEMACQLYPGVMVEYDLGLSAAILETTRLVADATVQRIHEATFSFEGVLVRVDILERTATGWHLIEVKGATSVKDYYYNDAAIQAWVLQGCGLKLDSVQLMHVNNKFTYAGDGDYEGLLKSQDITEQVVSLLPTIAATKQTFVHMLDGGVPAIAMGSHCTSPYECEFIAHCQPKDLPEFPISILPGSREKQQQTLRNEGYEDIRDIPDGVLTNQKHLRVWRVTRSGEEEVDAKALAELNELPWPRYYIDFETIGLAVPRWEGLRPYMQTPFQWSCHIHQQDGSMKHVEFLDVTGNDPRRTCAEALVKHIGEEGMLIAYNAPFEKGVIRGLAGMFPDLSDALLEMNERFFDLLPITRNAYYHPSQHGSWSIKAVLPALVPELRYSDLEGVQNGGDAQLAWIQAERADADKQRKIANQLLEYCKLDTLAMVKIMDALLERA